MRKRIAYLAFAAALAFCYSCSNDEIVAVNNTPQDNEISFRPLNNAVTRATSLILDNLVSNGFYVTATYTSDHTAYFADQLFKRKTEDPECWAPYTGSAFTAIYWPSLENDILDFHAYAPSQDENAQLSVSNANVTTLNGCPEYTVTPATAAASQMDFLYVSLTGQDYQNGSMALPFAHKESQVGVVLKNTDAALTITVSEVSICNIASTGKFMNRDANPSTATTMGWGDFGAVTNYTQSITPATFTDATAAGTTWILIPHTLAAPSEGYDGKYSSAEVDATYPGAYIKVKMKVQSAANASIYYAGDAETYVDAIWPISTYANPATWEAGTYYTYTIDLAGGGYYEKNQATPSGDALDRVLNLHEITFASVTVSGWGDPNNTNVTMP